MIKRRVYEKKTSINERIVVQLKLGNTDEKLEIMYPQEILVYIVNGEYFPYHPAEIALMKTSSLVSKLIYPLRIHQRNTPNTITTYNIHINFLKFVFSQISRMLFFFIINLLLSVF